MEGDSSVLLWWGGMSLVALINIGIWLYVSRVYRRRKADYSDWLINIRQKQLYLSLIYVLGCGFRSVFPRGDLRRIVLVDSFISAVVVGRSVATIAELALGAQLSWLLWEIGHSVNDKRIITISRLIVPTLFVAECFSWYACLTSNYIGTTVEESLWAVAALMLIISFLLARSHYVGRQKTFVHLGILSSFGYFIYMVTVDVPTYFSSWLANEAAG
ncbi:MAG: hypothetical protein AAF570_03685, partial [Bacteroidota bacterium]